MKLEAIAPSGLHEKVLELVADLPGLNVLDAPAGFGALTERLLVICGVIVVTTVYFMKPSCLMRSSLVSA